MKIIPALDFLDGKIVRLHQGQYNQVTDFTVDLKELCAVLCERKIHEVHCVNLSAAKDPSANTVAFTQAVEFLLSHDLQVQVGGGIRSAQALKNAIKWGVHKVVIGTWAWENPEEFENTLQELPRGVVTLGFDVRYDELKNSVAVATQGWQQELKEAAVSFSWEQRLQSYLQKGVQRVLCTEVSRDGTMAGPHLPLYQMLLQKFPNLKLQASGGVRGAEDLAALRNLNIESVLIGKSWLLHWQTQNTLPEWIVC